MKLKRIHYGSKPTHGHLPTEPFCHRAKVNLRSYLAMKINLAQMLHRSKTFTKKVKLKWHKSGKDRNTQVRDSQGSAGEKSLGVSTMLPAAKAHAYESCRASEGIHPWGSAAYETPKFPKDIRGNLSLPNFLCHLHSIQALVTLRVWT